MKNIDASSASHTQCSRFQRTSVSQIPNVLTEMFLTRDVGDMNMIIFQDVTNQENSVSGKRGATSPLSGVEPEG